ncbi:polysaccharide deacetylase family protein [Brevundimonas sp.]|uniref:polysaccharide deacetylase family protein n=1 Tax=Brevundimonas sp. TaxID=1871086 RepID=UPI002D51C2E8|nr:polysaccharide deacetylase family protein [Brevundimonas sp.]HYC69259.1 polysaccharide deacetylase family protein [Brevundimonas sp.]
MSAASVAGGERPDNPLYDYSPITERGPVTWPDGARVAVYVGLNIEHFHLDKPSTSIWDGTAHLTPDPLNYGWRDYGNRVGVWRLIEIFDRHGVRPSVLLNSEAAVNYPQIIEAGLQRGWAWLAHGRTNSQLHAGFDSRVEERQALANIVDTIRARTGRRPRGWMGPGLTETLDTPELLRELGLSYVLDWTADDQPFHLNVPGMISVPYSVELNDISMFVARSFTGEQFYQAVVDQFDQLYADAAASGRVMAIALHPFVIGQPFRARYLDKALAYIAGHDGAWLTTTDAIAETYQSQMKQRPKGTRSE